jgi:hypothetical protein
VWPASLRATTGRIAWRPPLSIDHNLSLLLKTWPRERGRWWRPWIAAWKRRVARGLWTGLMTAAAASSHRRRSRSRFIFRLLTYTLLQITPLFVLRRKCGPNNYNHWILLYTTTKMYSLMYHKIPQNVNGETNLKAGQFSWM